VGKAVSVQVHPGGKHGVHGLHGSGEAQAGRLEGCDGVCGGHGVVGRGGGHGLDAAVLVLVLVRRMLVERVVALVALVALVEVLLLVLVLMLVLLLLLLYLLYLLYLLLLLGGIMVVRVLGHGARGDGQRPGLIRRVLLAVGVEGRVEGAVDRVEGRIEVEVLVVHGGARRHGGGVKVVEFSASVAEDRAV
jgi:hypothetical protein